MLLAFVAEQQLTVNAFTAPQMTSRSTTALTAKPQRLPENVDGVIYVNDRVRSENLSPMPMENTTIVAHTVSFPSISVHQLCSL